MASLGDGLETIVDDVMWAVERPVKFEGVWLRARTTILRLEDGSLWMHSPCAIDDALAEQLAALGPVKWLVVPNVFHHLSAAETASRFEDAKVIAPAGVTEKRKDLRIDVDIAERPEGTAELEPLYLAGVPFLEETVFFHRPTKTLIAADMLISACPRDHWSWRWAARLMGVYGKTGAPPDVRWRTKKRNAEAREAVDRILDHDIERIVVAHADPIVSTPKDQLQKAWRFVQ